MPLLNPLLLSPPNTVGSIRLGSCEGKRKVCLGALRHPWAQLLSFALRCFVSPSLPLYFFRTGVASTLKLDEARITPQSMDNRPFRFSTPHTWFRIAGEEKEKGGKRERGRITSESHARGAENLVESAKIGISTGNEAKEPQGA